MARLVRDRIGTRTALQAAIAGGDSRDWSFAWRSADYHAHLFSTMVPWPALAQSFLDDMVMIETAIRSAGLMPPQRKEVALEEVACE